MIPALQFDNWQWLRLQLATPVVLWGAWPFHRAAWANLKHGAATMDTLISRRRARAWLLVAVRALPRRRRHARHADGVRPHPRRAGSGADEIYLEVAAVVTTFLLAGPLLRGARQAPRRRRADGAARARAPRTSRCSAPTAPSAACPVEELAVGDRFVVRPGEKVATDGVVEEGTSRRRPVAAHGRVGARSRSSPGDEVAGATVNAGGRLVVRATRVGADTALAQIARLVTDAQSGKAPVQRLADRVSGVFVPVVIGARRRDARLLARRRRVDRVRLHRRRRGADHRLPVRARPRDADRAARRHRPRRPARAC